MVKNIMFVFLFMFFFLACDFTPLKDSAFVTLPLNPGDPSIVKVHMAVFEGDWDVKNLIMTTELTASNSRVEVPIGNDLTFLFVASNNQGKGVYFGSQKNVYIESSGGTNLNTIALSKFDNSSGGGSIIVFDFIYFDITKIGEWTDLGATQYVIYFDDVYVGTTDKTWYDFGAAHTDWGTYKFKLIFSFFDLETIDLSFNVG